ncbi:DNL zinc finger-domain-containing protein [Ephemerocybe angulata]|uniref:DNL zinc finger-domain-containing protein n=1 Tax=Ephemerocybe angulata TaxID=980116 RepID=A0A8H6I5L0_9AGAR|nr:DNL zinc finger-domain-containing protein [Tulosesus angulatus]KAF6759343.1 DNL zinc finger-domain-containing protein [Tulosesus angulatus]
MAIAFTCTVTDCGHRQGHIFSKRSYEKGIVIVTCSSCKNRHLIADHLGWFQNLTGDGANVTIEQLAKAHGVPLTKGRVGESEVLEVAGQDSVESTTNFASAS